MIKIKWEVRPEEKEQQEREKKKSVARANAYAKLKEIHEPKETKD